MIEGIDYSEIVVAVNNSLLEARKNIICKVVNEVLGTHIKQDDFTKELLKDFVLLEALHLDKTIIQYKGKQLGEVVRMEPPMMGWSFIEYNQKPFFSENQNQK